MKTTLLAVSFFVLGFTSIVIAETEKNGVTDLIVESCNKKQVNTGFIESSPCTTYIDGFVSGAKTFDYIMVEHIRQDHENSSEFFQRAYQTRVGAGKNISDHQPPLFCLPVGLTQNQLVEQLVKHLPGHLANRSQLNDYMVTNLVKNYPCK